MKVYCKSNSNIFLVFVEPIFEYLQLAIDIFVRGYDLIDLRRQSNVLSLLPNDVIFSEQH